LVPRLAMSDEQNKGKPFPKRSGELKGVPPMKM
jgi:hypothetical protein